MKLFCQEKVHPEFRAEFRNSAFYSKPKKSNNISKIDTVLQTEYGINDKILENTVIIPLSDCIDAHHRKLQNKVSLTIKECIQNAHLIIINDPALHCLGENTEDTINNAQSPIGSTP